MSAYRSPRWYVNRRMTGLALARARAQGEAAFRRAQEQATAPAPLRPDPDVHERAGFAPVSLEPPYRMED